MAPRALVARGASSQGRAPGQAAASRTRVQKPPRQNSANVGNLLLRLRPDLSAAMPITIWQAVLIVGSGLALVIGLAEALIAPSSVVSLALLLPFFSIVALRLAALFNAMIDRGGPPHIPLPALDAELPSYAVLVALYDEAEVVPGLVDALATLDYPAQQLAVRFVVEAKDVRTQMALSALRLPPHMQVIIVPDGKPRTKPRALNYALARTPGRFVVVYDAEDLPEPDQLRRALSAFAAASPDVACLQARLNILNVDDSMLSRQFTIEYSALFDMMLPALGRMGLPIPLGGTSNHFRRAALEAALAWDPHNVTEDADLGIRLSRFGLKVDVLNSTTWEEAPTRYRVWLRQRTRWLKGWMQTWLVHMRHPIRLIRDIGVWPFLGLQFILASMIVSALVHPWFYVAVAHDALNGDVSLLSADGERGWLPLLALVNLIAGYLSAMLLGAFAVLRRGRGRLVPSVLLIPVYWLLVSVAAYRALLQLIVAPYHWEKTPHSARPAQASSATIIGT